MHVSISCVAERVVLRSNLQAQDVAANEDLGEPVYPYDRVFHRVGAANETAEDHVDRCREEDGCE